MSKKIVVLGVVCIVALLAVVGCANPAENKPEAVVADPTTETQAAAEGGTRYVIGEGSTVNWVGSKVTGSHEGGFRGFEGEVWVVEGKPELSRVEIKIDSNTLWADSDRLTGHLKSPDFFDVAQFPESEFVSTSVVPSDEGYTMTGNLTLHGVTKSVSFPAQISVEDGAVSATAEFFIKRFDFDIVYKGKADDLIRDEVVIKLDIRANPA